MKKIVSLLICLLTFFTTASAMEFFDVTEEYAWAAEAISELSDSGVIVGYGDGSFKPDGNITRAETAKVLTLLFGTWEEKCEYNDIEESDWFYGYVMEAGGYFVESESFLPNTYALRKEIAYGIYMASDTKSDGFDGLTDDEKYERAVLELTEAGILKGYPDGSLGEELPVTRAEFAVIIKRVKDLGYVKSESPDAPVIDDKKDETADKNDDDKKDEVVKNDNPYSYFFVVTDVMTFVDDKGEKCVKIVGYENGEYAEELIYDDAEIVNKEGVGTKISENDIIYIFRDYYGKVMSVMIAANAENLQNREDYIKFNINGKNQTYVFGKAESVRNGKTLELIVKTDAETGEKTTEGCRLGDNVNYYVYEDGEISTGRLSKIKEDRVNGKGDYVFAFLKSDEITDVLIIK